MTSNNALTSLRLIAAFAAVVGVAILALSNAALAQENATPSAAPAAAAPAAPATAPEPDATQLSSATPTGAPQAASQPAAPTEQTAEAPPHGNATLPRNLSPWSMFQSADIVVKGVMIGLAFASLVTWTVWLAKSIELMLAKRKLGSAFRAINASASLAEATQKLAGRKGPVTALIELAALELRLSHDIADKTGIKQRVASRLDGLVVAAGRDMNKGTGVIATIGSTAPFVGLFGTVWGIMNSFIGISESQTTNLAIVAPGIAEALLATAIGLVAAIPAVIIYNHFARSIAAYRAAIAEASAEVQRLVSRDLDRGLKTVSVQAAE